MSLPTKEQPKIKFCKPANQWVKTYYELSSNGKEWKQIQEWTEEKPE